MGSLKSNFAQKRTVTALHMLWVTYQKDLPDLFIFPENGGEFIGSLFHDNQMEMVTFLWTHVDGICSEFG